MKRIDTSSRAVDLFGAGKDGFRDGNKALGVSPTDFNAEWVNNVQEEIANVIEYQGGVLNQADKTQLLKKIISIARGGDYKDSVRSATTVAINLAAPGANIDDVPMALGDRFLDKNHATLALRGIYIWNGAAVPATRALDAADGTEFNSGAIIPVQEGTLNKDTNWQLITDGVITIGVTGLSFQLLNGNVAVIPGARKNLKGNANGTSSIVNYTIDEIITGDGAGNYQTTRGWNNTITLTTLGVGGLDQGVVAAASSYYSYAITKPDGTKGLIASLNAVSPSLLNAPGYTEWARVGSFFTDATANKYPFGFTQIDDVVQYKVAAGTNVPAVKQMASGAPANLTAGTIGIGAFVPPTAKEIIVQLYGALLSGQVGTVAPNTSYTSSEGLVFISSSTTTAQSTVANARFLLEGPNIYYSATNTVSVRCVGYVENF